MNTNQVRNSVSREKDYYGNYLWIPFGMIWEFKDHLLRLQDESHDCFQYEYDTYHDKYSKFMCPENDVDTTPLHFVDTLNRSSNITYDLKVFQSTGESPQLNGLVTIDTDKLAYALMSSSETQTMAGVQAGKNVSDDDKKELRKQLDIVSKAMKRVNKIIYPERYEN